MKSRLKIMKMVSLPSMILLAAFLTACGGGGDGLSPTPTTYEAEATIGPEGGEVEVTDPSNPLYGTSLIIPDGVLENNTIITIRITDNSEIPLEDYFEGSNAYEIAGQIIELGPSGLSFSKSVTLRLPSVDLVDDKFLMIMNFSENSDFSLTVGEMVAP